MTSFIITTQSSCALYRIWQSI